MERASPREEDARPRDGARPWGAGALLGALTGAAAWAGTAEAHAGGAAFVLLLPTHLYLLGGSAAVALSFLALALLPGRAAAALRRLRPRALAVPPAEPRGLALGVSLAVAAGALVLVAAGVGGSRDPLANPLPTVIWALWWVALAYAHALFGDLWATLNPWGGLCRLLAGALGARRPTPLTYPARAGQWPAVAGFLAFAWFELVHPAPMDPAVLAGALSGYLLAHLVGTLVFGTPWLRRAEAFAGVFRLMAWLAPVDLRGLRRGRWREGLSLPGLRLLAMAPPDTSELALILLLLAAVSFDGLSRTFAWLGWLGVNPLLYPGRTALVAQNTAGLLGLWAVLALGYLGAVHLGARWGGLPGPTGWWARRFAPALIPIACGYHFAHYLPVVLVDGQYALRALSDPFGLGWNLLGTSQWPVITSLVTDPARVSLVWHLQVTLIVAAHVLGVVVAHALALEAGGRGPVRGQLPLVVLMLGYTLLGLWLLSTPTVG